MVKDANQRLLKRKVNIDFYQSNIEGEIVNKIQESRKLYSGMIINAAAFSHTSVAIRDALSLFKKPTALNYISRIFIKERNSDINLL